MKVSMHITALILVLLVGVAVAAPPPVPSSFPSNIIAYIPITLTNYQSTAVAANTPIAIGTDSSGNIIGINALTYQQYYTCNLNNAEFFFGNGTVANSWLEGNMLNEQTANALCTSASSPNALVDSANILYWVRIPNSNFLPANTGTATTNTIYLGWTGNVLTSANNLLSNTITGEAPTISSGYGQYDNGANVFNLYFNGDTPLSDFNAGSNDQLTQVSGVTIGSDTSANVLYVAGYDTNRYNMVYNSPLTNGNYVIESSYALNGDLGDMQGAAGLSDTATSVSNGNAISVTPGYASSYFALYYASSGTQNKGIDVQGTDAADVWAFSTINYISTATSWSAFTAPQLYSKTGGYGGTATNPLKNAANVYLASIAAGLSTNPTDIYINWQRARIYPPNGIMPETTLGAIQTTSCSAYITDPSNTIADVGQYESFTASQFNCVNPFTYNVLVVNSVTPGTITHNDLLTGQTANSVTFTFQTVSADTSNSPEEANVVVTDSGTNTVTSGYSSTFTVNPALSSVSLSSSPSLPSTQGTGNTITFTSTVTGGSSPYSYNYIITNTITGTIVADQLYTDVSSTSNSFEWTIPSNLVGNTVAANVIVTDGATTPETVNSAETGTLTIVYTVPSTPTLSSCPSLAKIDVGQTVSCTATVSGGTSPYTYNWLISNTVTGAITANMLFTGVSSTSNTFTYTAVNADTANSPEQFNVIITDSHPTTVNSVYSGNFIIHAALSISSISPIRSIDTGQSILLTVSWSGGTSPYIVKWYTGLYGNTCSQDSANVIATYSGLTATTNSILVSPTTTNSYCASITDSASTPVTQLSPVTVINVYADISVPSISPTNFAIDNGQPVTFTANWSRGSPTFGASLYSSSTSTCNQQSTLVQQQIGIAYSVTEFSPVYPTSNTYYCMFVTDNSVNSYSIVNSITSGFNTPKSIDISPDGTYAYVTNYNSNNVVIINTATNTVVNSITSGFSSPQGVAFSPSGTYAYVTNGGSNNVVIINTGTNTVTTSIASGFNGPDGVSISPSGTYAYVTNYNSNNVVIINTGTNTVTTSIASGFNGPTAISFSPSGTYAYVINYASNNMVIINTATNTVTGSIATGFSGPARVSISPSGTYAYATNIGTNNTVIINTATNTIIGSIISGFSHPYGISFSPSGKYAYVTNGGSNNVVIINTDVPTNNSITTEVKVNAVMSTPTISPSNPVIDSGQLLSFTSSWSGGTPTYGASLYSSSTSTCNTQSTLVQQDIGLSSNSVTFSSVTPSANTYYCVYVTDNTPDAYSISNPITSGFTSPQGVAFSPSGTYAYVVNHNSNNVIIINTATNTVVNSITSGFNYPYGVVFSPSGTYAYVTNTGINNVLIINTATNTVVNSITSGFNFPSGVAISPNGKYAYVSNEYSNNVVIINTATNTVVNSITSGFNYPYGVAFSPSGTYAYVANYNSNNVVIINTATNTVTSYITQGLNTNSAQGVAFSPSGTYAYITNCNYDCVQGYPDNILIINTATNSMAGAIILTGVPDPVSVAFSPSGIYAYVAGLYSGNITIIDIATATTNTINTDVMINPALSIPTLTASNAPTVDTGQYESFTASWFGGTSSYTANYQVFNSVTGTVLANALYTGITGTSNSFLWLVPAADAGNTISANVFITDSASTPVTANSVSLSPITISAPVTTTTSTTTTTVTTTVSSGGGGNSGGIILNTIIPSSSSTSTSSTSSTSSSTSTSTYLTSSTSTTAVTSSSTSSTTTIKPVVIVKKANVSAGVVSKINFSRYNITVALSTNSVSRQNVTVSLYRPVNVISPMPQNYTNVFLFYLNSSSSEVNMNVTIQYNCKYSSGITPFVLTNDSWTQIYDAVLLQGPCRITFPAPNEHEIGLFVYSPVSSTTVASTATTTIIEEQYALPSLYYYAAAAILVLVVVTYLLYKTLQNRNTA